MATIKEEHELECKKIAKQIRAGGDDATPPDELVQLISEMRGKARGATKAAIGRELDTLLVREITGSQAALNRAKKTLERLGDHINTLTASPWVTAAFTRTVKTSQGARAEVVLGSEHLLVSVVDTVDLDTLRPGTEVFLGAERNVILGQAPSDQVRLGETAVVDRLLDSDRLVIRDHDTEIIIGTGDLAGGVKAGDTIRWHRGARLAVERLEPAVPLGILSEISGSGPEKIGGIDTAEIISQYTAAVLYPREAARYGVSTNRSLLLYGPPGCGKTSTMRAIASELSRLWGKRCRVITVNGAELESPWVGETQQNIKRVFRTAKDYDGPTLIFLDEVDAVGRIRGSASGHHSDKFLETWMTEMDGMVRHRVAVIAATNRKDLLDPAMLERLSALEIFVPRPNRDAARDIFSIHLADELPFKPNGASASDTRFDLIEAGVSRLFNPNGDTEVACIRFRDGTSRTVRAAELVSGRLIEQTCLQIRNSAFRREIDGGESGACSADMEQAIESALQRLRGELSIHNVRSYLDIPTDADVIAVDQIGPKVEKSYRYLRAGS
jgi:proteasome-associated ATPase